MHKFAYRFFLLMALTLPAFACGEAEGPNGEKLVSVNDDAFDPVTKTVNVGDVVLWQWGGAHQHNVTWVVTSGGGNSPSQATGSFSRSFSAAGSYVYYCTIHGSPTSGMQGTIVVQ